MCGCEGGYGFVYLDRTIIDDQPVPTSMSCPRWTTADISFVFIWRDESTIAIQKSTKQPSTTTITITTTQQDRTGSHCSIVLVMTRYKEQTNRREKDKIKSGRAKLHLRVLVARARACGSRRTTSWCKSASSKHLLRPEQRRFDYDVHVRISLQRSM